MVCWADDTCVQLDLEINNLCNDIYIYICTCIYEDSNYNSYIM